MKTSALLISLLFVTGCTAFQKQQPVEPIKTDYEVMGGICEVTFDRSKMTSNQFENMARVLRVEPGLKIFPLQLWNQPGEITEDLISDNQEHLAEGRSLIEEYKKLDVPSAVKKAKRKIVRDMEFDQWKNETLVRFLETNKAQVLRQNYKSVDVAGKCGEIVDLIDRVNTTTLKDEATYYLVFHKWSNCVNKEWGRFNDHYELWKDHILSERCNFDDEEESEGLEQK